MPNRLASETSPYLQQHAANPVDWYPWGEEALRLARAADKPILLSIGYSACHWCHVMAHESFEDAETAALMNAHFVNVKVDREERPDLDQVYQLAHQVLTRRGGGWPLTMFLTPEGVPFFAGTYFPKAARYGMPGFTDLLPRIAQAYRENRGAIEEQNASLLDAFKRSEATAASARELERAPIEAAVRELAQVFDDVHGGIGRAPKFPHPHELQFCLRRHALDAGALSGTIATLTLTKMAQGGIYDQVAGGFCRYSTDEIWAIPHFEKMLYDNGPLLALYSDAWLLTRDPLYERTARGTAEWTLREMQAPDGGYYSSLDADSEGEEGRFYVWTRAEVERLLDANELAVAAPHYGLDAPPNFEGRYWNLRLVQPLASIAATLGISVETCEARIASARAKLFAARERRVRPGRDEKVLTSWNALMAKGMARAGRVFSRTEWVRSAQNAVDFVSSTLWREGRLLATYKDGTAHLNAYLDDYAFLLDALLELVQTEFRPKDLELARALADALLEHFEDRERGGFYFTSHDHEQLIHRSKTAHDGATPSGNGIAAHALQRLGHLLGEPRYLAAAERTVRAFYEALERNASGHASLLTALEEALAPPRVLVLRGCQEALNTWQAQLAQRYRPATLVIALASDAQGVPRALDKPTPSAPHTVSASLCEGTACLPPLFDLTHVERQIGG